MISSSVKIIGVAAIAALPIIASAQDTKPAPSAPAPVSAAPVPVAPKEEPKMPAALPEPQKLAEPVAPAVPAAPKDMPVLAAPLPTVTDSATVPAVIVSPTPITPGDSLLPSQSPIVVVPAPIIPAADATLLDKAVKAMNTNNVDDFVSVFDAANFVFITPKADRITNVPELKVQWGNLFGATGALKGVKATFTPSKIIELSPGAASYDGSLMFTSAEGKTIRGVVSGSMKYADDAWKVSTMNFAAPDMIKALAEQEALSKQSSTSPMFMGIIGFALGVLGAIFMGKRKPKENANQ